MKLSLPPKHLLFRTNYDDPVHYHFIPGVGYVYKKRLKNTIALLSNGHGKKFGSLLEIAFGSGILFPELSSRAEKVFGLEIHDQIPRIRENFKTMGLHPELMQGSLLKMPYEAETFDAVVSVSVLEHIRNLDLAMREIKRVLVRKGVAILSFPVSNFITDTHYRICGDNPREIHPSTHRAIIEKAKQYFLVEEVLLFPRHVPMDLSLYCSIRCIKE